MINQELKQITVGRISTNDIIIEHSNISRSHARITICGPTMYLLEDLDSKHGTYVNNERIRRKLISEIDLVTFATHNFILKSLLQNEEIINDKNNEPKIDEFDFSEEFAGLEFVYEEYIKGRKETKLLEKSIKKWSIIAGSVVGIGATIVSGGSLGAILGLGATSTTFLSGLSSAGLSMLIPTLASDFLSTEEKIEILKEELSKKYRCPKCKKTFGERPFKELQIEKKCSSCRAIWVK